MTLKPRALLKDRYEIKDIIGRGGLSVVYLAHDLKFKSDVAIKEFNPESAARFGDPRAMLKRFEQEARITRQLRHSHIIEIFDLFSANDTSYIVMPYLPSTLADRLEHLNTSQAVQVMMQICDGLAYAHNFRRDKNNASRVVHCDIKPANILFEKNQAKITDFGIAHVPAGSATSESMTTALFVAGTAFYMPPEQLEGTRDDPRVDVYALGALFYRMLTQGHYYLDFDTSGTTEANLENRLRIFKQTPQVERLKHKVPQALIAIILKALSKDPNERYANAGEMLQAIKNAKNSPRNEKVFVDTEYLEPGTIPGPLSDSKSKIPYLAALAFIIVIGALILWQVNKPKDTPDATIEPTIAITPTATTLHNTPPTLTDTAIAPTVTTPTPTRQPSASPTDTLPPTTAAPTPTFTPVPGDTSTPPPPPTNTSTPPPPLPTDTPTPIPTVAATVRDGGASLRPGADTWWFSRQTLPAGTELELIGYDPAFPDWVYVRTVDGAADGWTQVENLQINRDLDTLPRITPPPTLTSTPTGSLSPTPPDQTTPPCVPGPLQLDAWSVGAACTSTGWGANIFVAGHGGDCMYTYAWNEETKGGPMPGSMTFVITSASYGTAVVGNASVTSAGTTVVIGLYIEPPDCSP